MEKPTFSSLALEIETPRLLFFSRVLRQVC
jgi:hypothetical protein